MSTLNSLSNKSGAKQNLLFATARLNKQEARQRCYCSRLLIKGIRDASMAVS